MRRVWLSRQRYPVEFVILDERDRKLTFRVIGQCADNVRGMRADRANHRGVWIEEFYIGAKPQLQSEGVLVFGSARRVPLAHDRMTPGHFRYRSAVVLQGSVAWFRPDEGNSVYFTVMDIQVKRLRR